METLSHLPPGSEDLLCLEEREGGKGREGRERGGRGRGEDRGRECKDKM